VNYDLRITYDIKCFIDELGALAIKRSLVWVSDLWVFNCFPNCEPLVMAFPSSLSITVGGGV